MRTHHPCPPTTDSPILQIWLQASSTFLGTPLKHLARIKTCDLFGSYRCKVWPNWHVESATMMVQILAKHFHRAVELRSREHSSATNAVRFFFETTNAVRVGPGPGWNNVQPCPEIVTSPKWWTPCTRLQTQIITGPNDHKNIRKIMQFSSLGPNICPWSKFKMLMARRWIDFYNPYLVGEKLSNSLNIFIVCIAPPWSFGVLIRNYGLFDAPAKL
jgi:hypothetical protein